MLAVCTDEVLTGSYLPRDSKPQSGSEYPLQYLGSLSKTQLVVWGQGWGLLCSSPFLALDTPASEEECDGHLSGLRRAGGPERGH